jgi:hypothetical protein
VITVPGIGHRIKSRNNPDLRVELVKDYVKANFPNTKLLDYALAVETVTTSKKDNLILNVDGCIAVCFVDLLRNCGAFSPEEAEDYLGMGVLNGLFVLGRSIGLIAHFLDQKRLRTGLYRHPWDDITYVSLLPSFLSSIANQVVVISSQLCRAVARVVSKLPSRRLENKEPVLCSCSITAPVETEVDERTSLQKWAARSAEPPEPPRRLWQSHPSSPTFKFSAFAPFLQNLVFL